jgi:crotonobetainyl-CoA:carnitine CoA-transferase CaiB-like acyl-CoA transferase
VSAPPGSDGAGKTAGPLAGLLVADFSRVVAGPYTAMLLGDLGADVVKVERPGKGDDTRGFGPPFVSSGEGEPQSAYFLSVNRNKRAVAWDLSSEEGRERGRSLASRADVLVENWKPGGAAKFGLSYEAVAADNPAVVYCSVSGFGSSGPGAVLPGYDFLAQATGGLMSITGDEGEPPRPRKVGVAVVDVLTALFACNAILAALFERSRSGKGQKVEVDLLSVCLASLINQASTYLTTGKVPRALGNRHPSIAPYETLKAADRDLVVAVGNDSQFGALTSVLGKEWMSADPRFSTNAARVVNREEMVAELEEALAGLDAAVWVGRLRSAGVPTGVVNDVGEAFAFAEAIGLSPVVRVGGDGELGWASEQADPRAQVASPMRLERTPVSYRLAPPLLGEHGSDVEKELGFREGG